MSGRGNPQRGDRGRGRGQGQPQGSNVRGSSPGRGRGERGRGDSMSPEGRGGRGSGFRGGPGGRGRSDFRGGPPGGRTGSVIFQPGPVPPIDARLSPKDLDQLVNSFKKLEVKVCLCLLSQVTQIDLNKHDIFQTDLPLRPGFGTAGRQITLRANFFPVRVPKGPIYDYSVEISPKTDFNRIKARLFFLLEQSPVFAQFKNHIAHDGTQRLISARQLPQPLDVQISFYEDGETGPQLDGKTYVVSITHVRDLDTNELTK